MAEVHYVKRTWTSI